MQAYEEMKKENDSLKFKLLKIETILQEAKCRQEIEEHSTGDIKVDNL